MPGATQVHLPFQEPRRLPLRHYVKRGIEIAGGSTFLSPLGQAMWRRLLQDLPPATLPPGCRTALVAHAYYPHILPEILNCLACIPFQPDLIVTTGPDQETEVRAGLKQTSTAHILVVPNRGRDIAPFLAVLNAGLLDRYNAVLKLHTKRSPHLLNGDMRRRLLFTLLAGHPIQAERAILRLLSGSTGIVGWKLAFRAGDTDWMGNRAAAERLARRIMPALCLRPAFFEGSMFWFRPAALEPMRRLNLAIEDFEEECGQTDGALHHAIERLFCLVAQAAGYRTCSLSGEVLLEPMQRAQSAALVQPEPAATAI